MTILELSCGYSARHGCLDTSLADPFRSHFTGCWVVVGIHLVGGGQSRTRLRLGLTALAVLSAGCGGGSGKPSGAGGAGGQGGAGGTRNGTGGGGAAGNAGAALPVATEIGTTCDTSPRASFATIVTPSAVYLVEGIPVDVPTPLSTTVTVGRAANGSLDSATCMVTAGMTVPVALYGMGVATVASSVYLIGGNVMGTTNTQTAVYRAEIANGSLTPFSEATLPGAGGAPVVLQTSGYGQEIVQIQNYVYVIGGWSSTGQTNVASVERAQVDLATGDFITNFAPAVDPNTGSPVTMAVPRFDTVAIHLGSWIYVLGGQTDIGSAALCHDEIQRASVDANGNLSGFMQVGTLPSTLCLPATHVVGNTLYVLGGTTAINSPGNPLSTDAILTATIAADGSLGAFVPSSAALSYPVGFAGAALLGNTLYLLDGWRGTTGATNSIQAVAFP